MQPKTLNKYLLALSVAAATASVGVNAATANYAVGFTTVPDIGITQVTAMNFGAYLGLSAGASCTLQVTDTGTAATYPGDVTLRIAGAAANTAGADAGELLSVSDCTVPANTLGTVGIYEIQGIAGGTVNVTIQSITAGADFNYTPSGCVGNYNNAGDGDTCIAVVPDAAVQAVIASAGDTVGNGAGEGIPTPGATRIALGGTILATAVHTAGQTLTEDFTIVVTY